MVKTYGRLASCSHQNLVSHPPLPLQKEYGLYQGGQDARVAAPLPHAAARSQGTTEGPVEDNLRNGR